jgi:S1-C subfamily serine protease
MNGVRFSRMIKSTVSVLLLVLPVLLGWSQSGTGRTCKELIPGVFYTQKIEITEGRTDYVTVCMRVPENTMGIWVKLFNSPLDLDIFLNHEEQIKNYDDVDFSSTSPDFNETLFLSRFSDVPLKTGLYYIDIAYQRKDIPLIQGKRVFSIPFSIKIDLLRNEVSKELSPDMPEKATLFPEEGMFKTFRVTVPPESSSLRIDLFDSINDLDLLIKKGRFPYSWEDADYTAESFLSREHISISNTEKQYLTPGDYYITVIDQLSNNRPADFSIIAGFSKDPPSILKKLPALPVPEDAIQNALMATVEIAGTTGTGSGCLVSPDGLILTNWHVVRDDSGNPVKEPVVAFTLSYELPPEELFRAEVVGFEKDTDLALLKITEGFYNQKIPEGYRFPYFQLGKPEAVRIGETIGLIGFPGIGGTGSRASVTYTRGILSGLEKTSFGTLFKTDGQITQGNSGGAAVNDNYELIGLPTTIIEKNAGQIGFIHPITLLPDEWLEMISSSLQAANSEEG